MSPTKLLDLPGEVLMQVLSPLSTQDLLGKALVCTHFHNLVLRIVHHRLALAASLKDHKVIFECFHPVHKNIDPYLFCDYLGTPGLSTKEGSRDEPVYFEHDGRTGFGRLGSMYSWFRPVPPEEMARLRRPHPSRAVGPALQNHDPTAHQPFGAGRVYGDKPKDSCADGDSGAVFATCPVNLDPDEGFTQMTMQTSLVKLGPRRGLFAQIEKINDNTTRLKRDWLRQVTACSLNIEEGTRSDGDDELRTLWIDDSRNIGLKVRMKERTVRREVQPLLYREADPAVSYTMQYDVLYIRTTRLLIAVEKALLQDRNDGNGKALIIGSFASQIIQHVPAF